MSGRKLRLLLCAEGRRQMRSTVKCPACGLVAFGLAACPMCKGAGTVERMPSPGAALALAAAQAFADGDADERQLEAVRSWVQLGSLVWLAARSTMVPSWLKREDLRGSPYIGCILYAPKHLVYAVPPVAVDIARAVYERDAWHELPVLADALEEYGYDHGEALEHLRSSGPHARGCWPVDLMLGKE